MFVISVFMWVLKHMVCEMCRYREWAPGAQAIALVGEFNNWEPAGNHWAMKDEFGNFNLFLADPSPGVSAVPHRCSLPTDLRYIAAEFVLGMCE